MVHILTDMRKHDTMIALNPYFIEVILNMETNWGELTYGKRNEKE